MSLVKYCLNYLMKAKVKSLMNILKVYIVKWKFKRYILCDEYLKDMSQVINLWSVSHVMYMQGFRVKRCVLRNEYLKGASHLMNI